MKLTSHARGTTQPVVLTPHTIGTSPAAGTDAVFKLCPTLVVAYIPRCWHWCRYEVLPHISGTFHPAVFKFCPTLVPVVHPTLVALMPFWNSASHWWYIPRWWYWRRWPLLMCLHSVEAGNNFSLTEKLFSIATNNLSLSVSCFFTCLTQKAQKPYKSRSHSNTWTDWHLITFDW